MRIPKGRPSTPEQEAAAEARMARSLRTRRGREPLTLDHDPYAALDVPDVVTVQLYRCRSRYAGVVSWSWWARTYPVEHLSSTGDVVRTSSTQHVPNREVVRTFELAPSRRPVVGSLLRDLSRCVWSLGGARDAAPATPYWQPPLPGL